MTARFEDPQHPLLAYAHDALVACPRCGARTVVRQAGGGSASIFAPHRVACAACSYVAEHEGGGFAFHPADPRDPFFRLPLWLQAPCCGEVLWAYNAGHLDLLEGFVGATLRERTRDADGWYNKSVASRLPAWMTSRKNRAEVLRVIAQLRQRLP